MAEDARTQGWSHIEYLARLVAEQATADRDRRLAARLRYASATGTHAGTRARPRAVVVQPFSPWMQFAGPSASSSWKDFYLPSARS
ncbi:MAG: hypothetical protein AB7Q27_05475 [Acidimicrobiia bacterium]